MKALMPILALGSFALLLSACGASVDPSEPTSGPGAQAGASDSESGQSDQTAGDEPPTADPCSVLHPGSAKPLPAGLVVPSGAAAFRIDFELADQRIVPVAIRGRQVAPAWTTKDTQIFSPSETAGFWVETRTAADQLSYQRNLYDPLSRTTEAAPNPQTGEGWNNSTSCRPEASFDVEVPSDGADEIRIYGNDLLEGSTKLLAWYRLH